VPVYRIEFAPAAYRNLKNLPEKTLQRIRVRIDGLISEPRPSDCVKLKGAENIYRIRTGDYRILYQVKDELLLVLVVKIGHRKEVYKY
jgi:mRNA interferase RelE/StbE